MRKIIPIHDNWLFSKRNTGDAGETVTLPHTWNAVDGQDGGNDYYRGTCYYTRQLTEPEVDPSPGGSQDTGGAFRSRVQRPGVRHRPIGAGHICPMWQRTDLAQVKRDRHTGRPRKARSIKAFRLRQSIISAEIHRKRFSLPTGEVRPSEHNYDCKEIF